MSLEDYEKIKTFLALHKYKVVPQNFATLYDLIKVQLNITDPSFVFNCLNYIMYKKTPHIQVEELKIPTKYQRIDNQFKFLSSIPEIAQKSAEWYEKRHNLITASSCAEALNENSYTTRDKFLVQKCLPNPPFEQSVQTHHGVKYEDIATMIYEELFDVGVKPFGLIGHPNISFLGASPDGICDKWCKKNNKKFSTKYGTMLEIKCPFRRVIKKEGKIDGDICPHYYWVQVQVQLECCDLDTCDFWQCTIREYNTREEWFLDVRSPLEVKKDLVIKNINTLKGAIIQLLPKNDIASGKISVFNAKYIYPHSLDMNVIEYENWILSQIYSLQTVNSELARDYVFDRVIYWKLDDCHVQEICRDKEWFSNTYPRLKTFWDEVLYYRQNPEKFRELQLKMSSFSYAGN